MNNQFEIDKGFVFMVADCNILKRWKDFFLNWWKNWKLELNNFHMFKKKSSPIMIGHLGSSWKKKTFMFAIWKYHNHSHNCGANLEFCSYSNLKTYGIIQILADKLRIIINYNIKL